MTRTPSSKQRWPGHPVLYRGRTDRDLGSFSFVRNLLFAFTSVVAFLGAGLMLWWFAGSGGDGRVVVLGLAYATAMIAGAAALLVLLARHVHRAFSVSSSLVRSLASAALAYGAARLAVAALPAGTRAEAALTLVVGAALAVAVYGGLQLLARAPEFKGISSEVPA